MASIKNSISLQDRMTPVFRSILKSMDSTMRVMRDLDKQANKGVQSKAYQRAERDIKRANNELIKMQNYLNGADRSANKLASSTSRVSTNMVKMSQGGLNLHNLAHGLYLLKNIESSLSGIMESSDTMSAVQYRLATYDTTDATGQQLLDASYLAAQRSRSSVSDTANLASRILISGATGGSGAESIDLAEILNKASFLGGSSSQESQRALLQLSQALASGVLQGDELRAIREQAPGLTDVLARGLSSLGERGLLPEKFIDTTMGDLKKLGADGELTAGRVIAAFREMRDYVNTTFEDSPKQFGQATTAIANVWKRWLNLMSQGDNAFAQINNRAWELAEWFESDSGAKFFETLARGINIAVDGLFKIVDGAIAVGQWFAELDNSSQILQSALLTLGIIGAASGLTTAVAWAIANWQILLAATVIGIVIYALMQTGLTAAQIVGGIAGAFMFLAYVVWDAILIIAVALSFIGLFIWDLILGIVMIVIAAIQIIVQIIMWLIVTIWGVLVTIYDAIYTIVVGAWGVIKAAIVGVYALFASLGTGVLGILYAIASAIDWVFGSNLAGTVQGWMDGLGQSVIDLEAKLNVGDTFESIGDQWKDSYGDLGTMYTDSWNITDNIGSTWDMYGDAMIDPLWLNNQIPDSMWANPMDGWNSGYDFGSGLTNGISDLAMSMSDISNIEDIMNSLNTDGLDISGGNLDSVGSIKSDVDISDEDLKLLKEMAARDFLLNLQSITPVANIKFGDIHETADVDKIMEVIQDMVDEELATSLVVS